MSNAYVQSRVAKSTHNYYPFFPADNNNAYTQNQRDIQSTSEDLYRHTSIGKTLVDNLTHYVIGKGLVPMSAPEISLLGWSAETTKKFQKQAEAYWRLITEDASFDWYGVNNFNALQRIGAKNIFIAGDTLLHLGFREISDGKIRPYVQLISGKMVANAGGNLDSAKSVGGVLLDKFGRHVGYQLKTLTDTLDESYETRTVSRYNSLNRLEFTLISLDQNDPTLVRGIPILNSLRDDILNLNKFKDNHLTKSAIQSMFTAFIEKTADAPDTATSFHDKLLGSGARETEDAGERVVNMGAGVIVDLENGEHANLCQSQANGDDYNNYVRAVIEGLAASLGMSYETVMGAFNSSFSASRAGLNSAEKNFSIIRSEFADKFCQPVWNNVITHGILSGYIEAPGFGSDDLIDKAILSTTWTGVTPPQVDPVKEVKAYTEAINMGLCTRDYACRNLYGMDAEEVAERLRIENEMLSFMPQQNRNAISANEEEMEDNKNDE